MLKKLSVLFACLLSFGALAAFSACGGEEGKEGEVVKLVSFESYAEVQKYRMLNEFGEISLTREKEYVTDGSAALKVRAAGNYRNPNNYPAIGILTGAGNAVEKTDFEDVKEILLDIYNANETEEKVYFQYLTRTEVGMKLSSRNTVTVPAKTKITAKFPIERDFLAKLLNLKSVSQLRIAFDNAKTYRETPREFYIDNLRAVLTEQPLDPSAQVRKTDEIESADREDYLAAWENMNSYNFAPSSLTFNAEPSFIKEGSGSFCMTNVIGFDDSTDSPYYGGGWKMLVPFNDFTPYTSIQFWMYLDCSMPIDVLTVKANGEESVYVGHLEPNTWTQMTVNVTDLGTEEEMKKFERFFIVVSFPKQVTSNIYFDGIYAVK